MPELPGGAGRAPVRRAVEDHAKADALADRHQQEVGAVGPRAVEPLGRGDRADVVVDQHGQAKRLAQGAASGMPVQPRRTDMRSVPVSGSTTPGTATPTPSSGSPAAAAYSTSARIELREPVDSGAGPVRVEGVPERPHHGRVEPVSTSVTCSRATWTPSACAASGTSASGMDGRPVGGVRGPPSDTRPSASSFLVIVVTVAGLSSSRSAISARLSGPCRASSASTAVLVMSPETDTRTPPHAH